MDGFGGVVEVDAERVDVRGVMGVMSVFEGGSGKDGDIELGIGSLMDRRSLAGTDPW